MVSKSDFKVFEDWCSGSTTTPDLTPCLGAVLYRTQHEPPGENSAWQGFLNYLPSGASARPEHFSGVLYPAPETPLATAPIEFSVAVSQLGAVASIAPLGAFGDEYDVTGIRHQGGTPELYALLLGPGLPSQDDLECYLWGSLRWSGGQFTPP